MVGEPLSKTRWGAATMAVGLIMIAAGHVHVELQLMS